MNALPLWAWGAFLLFIVAMLALVLGVFHRKSHDIKMKEALGWCGVWFTLAMIFNGIVWKWLGPKSALEFFTGYLIEIDQRTSGAYAEVHQSGGSDNEALITQASLDAVAIVTQLGSNNFASVNQ